MKQALLLITLLFIVPQAHSQHQRVPMLNTEKASMPPDHSITPSGPVSYTKITFTNHYNKYDTSTMDIVKYSNDGKLLQTDEYEYNQENDFEESPFDRIQTYIGQGERCIYTYDKDGWLKTKKEYVVLPANSLNAIWGKMTAEALSQSLRDEREETTRDREGRAGQNLKTLIDLTKNGITESALLKEETRYDADGNEIYSSQPQNRSESRYIYTYDGRGQVTMQREVYSDVNGRRAGIAIYDRHFSYTSDGRPDSATTTYAGNDTNKIPADLLPYELVHYRYHPMGKPYVITYEKDGMLYTHILAYADTMVEKHTVLSTRTTDMTPKKDTVSVTTYGYNRNGNRTEIVSTYYYDGKRSSVITTRGSYNKEGQPVEVRKYMKEDRGGEAMTEQSIFLYNTPEDKEILERSMSYRRPKKHYKDLPRMQAPTQSRAVVKSKSVVEDKNEEIPAPQVYAGPAVAAPQQDVVFAYVEQKAAFNGDVNEFISKNLRYPAAAKEAGVEGNVVVRFVVMETGKVTRAELLKTLGSGCDEEALRLVSIMPPWTPGKNNGISVNSYYILPITFSLNK